MKIAEDFRRIARNDLTNKWFIAVAVGLVASILGGISGGGPEFKVNIDGSNISMNFNVAGQTIKSIGTNGGVDSEVGAFILASLPIIIIASLFAAVIYFVLGVANMATEMHRSQFSVLSLIPIILWTAITFITGLFIREY